MPLQNRVDPFGEICAVAARGGLMGNRGGRIHNDAQRLGRRRWASKAWISCVLEHKGWRRTVMGAGYTELFFLDEPTALAAGHRPCFLCRRPAARAFAAAWARERRLTTSPSAPAMDAALHAERLRPRGATLPIADLPSGAMALWQGGAWMIGADALWPWRFEGYGAPLARARHAAEEVLVLTPPSALAALRGGYRPLLTTDAPALSQG